MSPRLPPVLPRALALGLLASTLGLGAQGAPEALDRLNAAFLNTYREAKARQPPGTVIVLQGDRARLLRGGAVVAEAEVRPALYHRLKAVDHVVLALHLELAALDGRPLTLPTRDRLATWRTLTAQARAGLEPSFPQGAVVQRQQRILDRALGALDALLRSAPGAAVQAGPLARDLAPDLMANVDAAAALQLEALHRAVSGWRKAMAPAEWAGLRVVILGAHMPREGEVTWQYFSRLLGQPREGDRIIYAEGLGTLPDALDLLATHGVDRALGTAFFGDPDRMHRDLLADGAKAWLEANLQEWP